MANRKNILLLSAGRRVSLARAFSAVASANNAVLITADLEPQLSSACQDHGNFVTTPRISSDEFAAALQQICEVHEIGLVVPTIDTELAALAQLRDSLKAQGTTAVVSSSDLIAIARDKRKTATFFEGMNVPSPKVYPVDEPEFPVLAKPFDGSLSRDIHIITSQEEYTDKVRNIPNLMLTEYISPKEHDEYTCDAYYDSNCNLCCIVPRKRVQVRGGEVAKGRTERNNIVDLFESKLSKLNGARGCLTFQFFRNEETERIYLIELNARFGGGFPLTLAAGANYPKWLYNEYILDRPPEFLSDWQSNLTMLRYDEAVYVSEQMFQ